MTAEEKVFHGLCSVSLLKIGALQPVNILLELRRRGMETEEAEQYLDSGPEITFAVW